MNTANIQMNMGDFRGSDVPDSESQNFQWLTGMSAEDQTQPQDLMAMDEVQNGLEVLAQNFPAFSSMISALTDSEGTTEAPATEPATDGEVDSDQKNFLGANQN